MIARLRLRRDDGTVYLERWGVESKRLGGVFVHRMSAPDPGFDLHCHPWAFVSLILKGGYTERRANIRQLRYKHSRKRVFGSLALTRLDQAHTIESLHGKTSWSLIFHGRNVRRWGFYVRQMAGHWEWIDSEDYDRLYPHRRGLSVEAQQGLGVR